MFPITNTLPLLALFFCCCLFPLSAPLSTVSISPTYNGAGVVVCALTQRSFINCSTFPRGSPAIQINSPSSYSAVVGGKGFVCALRSPSPSASIMGCWRFSNSSAPKFKRIYHGPALRDLSAGDSHVCGIVNQTNQIQCWQWNQFRSPFDAQHSFSRVSVGDAFVCGLKASGNITCRSHSTLSTPPSFTGTTAYQVLAAGPTYACAINANQAISCWGNMASDAPRDSGFTSLALAGNCACALRSNGSLACWGESTFTVPTIVKENEFIAIEARGTVFCGVLTVNYSMLCWGNDTLLGAESSFVFDNVLPGVCTRNPCPCYVLPGANFCAPGEHICSQSCSASTAQAPVTTTNTRWTRKMVAFLVVGIVGCVSLAASMVFWYFVVKQGNSRSSSRVHDSGRLDEEAEAEESDTNDLEVGGRRRRVPVLEKRLSHIVSMGSIEEFSLQVLLQATNNFSPELRIGNGSYGWVYKAELADGRRVAIKRAETAVLALSTSKRNMETDTAFLAELGFLSKLNHKNLVRLLGFYEDTKERVLVYEYMPNGNLHDHLHKPNTSASSPSPLSTWPGRLRVALDAARGVEYLHIYAVPPVIHRDIKPSNILLDDNYTAKVSDFGLSLMGPAEGETPLSLLAAGTLGYIDPEYYRRHQLTSKSDVYSLGVVLLELLTGLKAIHLNENGSPRNVVDFVIPYVIRDEIHRVLDPKMAPPTPIEIEALADVGYLAAECVSLESRDRPSITEIVSSLNAACRAARMSPPTLYSSSSNTSEVEE